MPINNFLLRMFVTSKSSCPRFDQSVTRMRQDAFGCALPSIRYGLALGHGFPHPPSRQFAPQSLSHTNPLGFSFLTMKMPLGTSRRSDVKLAAFYCFSSSLTHPTLGTNVTVGFLGMNAGIRARSVSLN